MIKRTLWFFAFASMAISCLDQPDCFSLNNNYVGISFRKLSNGTLDSVGLTRVYLPEANVEFVPTTIQTSFDVPLNLYGNSTLVSIEAGGATYDLRLEYESQTQFVSEDCGAKFVITGLKASSDTFDSVRVSGSTPKANGFPGNNIVLLRCPNTSNIKLEFATAVTLTTIEATHMGIVTAPIDPITTLTLPLNTGEAQSSFVFTMGDGTKKNLTVAYERETDTLFNACGEQVLISMLEVGEHNFSTAELVRAAIQDSNQPNIEITL